MSDEEEIDDCEEGKLAQDVYDAMEDVGPENVDWSVVASAIAAKCNQ